MLSKTLQNLQRVAEALDSNLYLNNNNSIELELAITRMNQSWQKLSALLNKVKQNIDNFTSKWDQFKRLANELLDVIDDVRKRLSNSLPSAFSSSIERIKEQFDHVIVSLLSCLFQDSIFHL